MKKIALAVLLLLVASPAHAYMLIHTEVSGRTCSDCRRYSYDDQRGVMGPRSTRGPRDKFGRQTLPVYRPFNSPTPCHQCPKIPRGCDPVPENGVEITERLLLAYRHYRECLAVNWQTPDAADEIVRRNAGLILQVEDEADRERDARLDGILAALALRR